MSQTDDPKSDPKKKHLHELIADFDTAMLVTRAADGGLHARPVSIAKERTDERLYVATSVASTKVAEIQADEHVVVTFQDSARYVALRGTARTTHDRALVDHLWTEAWKVWFPKGKDDPTLVLVEVTPVGGEYWDQTGLGGMRYLVESVKAYAMGTKPPEGTDERQNAKVELPPAR
jgi:general stress protein 26